MNNTKKTKKNALLKTHITIWILLCISFLVCDFILKNYLLSSWLKLTVVLECFLFTLINKKPKKTNKDTLLKFAMFFTVIADLCILIMSWHTLGVAVFCVVQIIYFIRNLNITKKLYIHFIFFCFGLYIYYNSSNILIAITAFYSYCLISSIASAVFSENKQITIICGMFLFLACDICVLLYNLPSVIIITEMRTETIEKISEMSVFLIWLFYAPSQMLLSISSK